MRRIHAVVLVLTLGTYAQTQDFGGASEDLARLAPAEANAAVSVVRLQIPTKARDEFNRGVMDFRNNKLDDAERRANRAVQLYPSFPDALLLRGMVHCWRDQPQEAEQDMLSAMQADSSFPSTYIALADLYNTQGRFDEALRIIQRGIALPTMSWKGQYELARALIGKQQYTAALNTIERFNARDKTPRALLHLAKGYALAGLKKYHQATEELKSYLKQEPQGDGVPQVQKLLSHIQALPPDAGE